MILQELLGQPIGELSSADEYSSMNNSPSPSPMSVISPQKKAKRKPLPLLTIHSNKSDGALHEGNEVGFEMEQTPDIVTDDEWKTPDDEKDEKDEKDGNIFHFPMSHGLRPRSSSCSDSKSDLLRRADTAPLFSHDAKDTDYWISLVLFCVYYIHWHFCIFIAFEYIL